MSARIKMTIDCRERSEKERLKNYEDCRSDPHHNRHGVLLSDEITFYANKIKLIDPFVDDLLKPAGYELTVGNEYVIGGQRRSLEATPGRDEIVIPPFEVVVVQTAETINLPRFLIARWNIRVSWAYKGLLWVGGPQVDPGWIGRLPCPIYNLSNQEVRIRKGQPLALMDFVKTTPFSATCCEYNRPPKRFLIEHYEPDRLKSALFTEAGRKIREFEKVVDKIDNFIALTFVVLSVVVAALSVLFVADAHLRANALSWGIVSGLAVFAALMSAFAVFAHKVQEHELPTRLFGTAAVTPLITLAAIIIGLVFFYQLDSPIQHLDRRLQELDQLSKETAETERTTGEIQSKLLEMETEQATLKTNLNSLERGILDRALEQIKLIEELERRLMSRSIEQMRALDDVKRTLEKERLPQRSDKP